LAYLRDTHNPPAGCVFCAALNAHQDDQTCLVWRGQHSFCILNRFPYNNGHLLILPNRHVGQFESLSTAEVLEMFTFAQVAIQTLGLAYRPDGYNMGLNLGRAAGAGIPDHLHIHLLPRWAGDTNFMTSIGELRVLPETLEQTYQRLQELLITAWGAFSAGA